MLGVPRTVYLWQALHYLRLVRAACGQPTGSTVHDVEGAHDGLKRTKASPSAQFLFAWTVQCVGFVVTRWQKQLRFMLTSRETRHLWHFINVTRNALGFPATSAAACMALAESAAQEAQSDDMASDFDSDGDDSQDGEVHEDKTASGIRSEFVLESDRTAAIQLASETLVATGGLQPIARSRQGKAADNVSGTRAVAIVDVSAALAHGAVVAQYEDFLKNALWCPSKVKTADGKEGRFAHLNLFEVRLRG